MVCELLERTRIVVLNLYTFWKTSTLVDGRGRLNASAAVGAEIADPQAAVCGRIAVVNLSPTAFVTGRPPICNCMPLKYSH
jgi:hypothetical protein